MAKVLGIKQQRVQFFYDTLFRSRGDATVANITATELAQAERKLFVSSRGSFDLSNMSTGGQLVSDQTFLCYAVRHEVQFWGGTSDVAPFQSTAGVFMLFLNSTTFQFQCSEKVELEGPIAMTPAGGGPWGFVSDSTQPVLTNGEPQSRALYVLPIPVAVTKRQGISVTVRIFELLGTANNATVNVVNAVNHYTGLRLCRTYLDGYHTRDVL